MRHNLNCFSSLSVAVCLIGVAANCQNAAQPDAASGKPPLAHPPVKVNTPPQTAEAVKATALLRDKFVDVLLNGGAARFESLLKTGANPNVYSKNGLTPLLQALSASEMAPAVAAAVRKVLYKYGADVNLPEKKSGTTALMGETLWGRSENATELLKQSADPNRQNLRGQTALMWAMLHGHVSIATGLLAHKADAFIKDKDGKTALDYEKKAIEVPDMSGLTFVFEGTPAEKKRFQAMIERARGSAEKKYRQEMQDKRAEIAKQIRAATSVPKPGVPLEGPSTPPANPPESTTQPPVVKP